MPRKIPMRRCVATGEQLPKKELLRIVRTPEGIVQADPTGKANGRGAYLKKSPEAAAAARKTKALERSLEVSVPEEFWETLERYF
ncbi:MAG: YlxR family protein [Solobacterium sp.]|nr:YlxR family protein [Solobacterium sp.]